MRLRLVPVATLALAAALASVGCSNSGHPVGPSPSPFGPLPNVPVADSRPGVPAAAVKGFADALQLKRRKVHMIAGLTNGEHAVALLRFPDEGKETRRLVSFEYRARKKRWAVEAASSDLWDHPPAAGSRSYPVTSVPAGSWIGVGGFVDPKVRRLEAAGPTGSLVDQQPVKDGAALVFASPGSTLAGYDENGLVFATPVLAGLPQAVGGGDAAVGLGSTFAAEVISPRWAAAADLVSEDLSAEYLLPPLHEFLSSDRARVDGQGRKTKTGAAFIIEAGPLKWRLRLFTVPHGGTLKVRQYTLDRLSP